MYAQLRKPKENKNSAIANSVTQEKNNEKKSFYFVGTRPEAVAQSKLKNVVNNSPQTEKNVQLQSIADHKSTQVDTLIQRAAIKSTNSDKNVETPATAIKNKFNLSSLTNVDIPFQQGKALDRAKEVEADVTKKTLRKGDREKSSELPKITGLARNETKLMQGVDLSGYYDAGHLMADFLIDGDDNSFVLGNLAPQVSDFNAPTYYNLIEKKIEEAVKEDSNAVAKTKVRLRYPNSTYMVSLQTLLDFGILSGAPNPNDSTEVSIKDSKSTEYYKLSDQVEIANRIPNNWQIISTLYNDNGSTLLTPGTDLSATGFGAIDVETGQGKAGNNYDLLKSQKPDIAEGFRFTMGGSKLPNSSLKNVIISVNAGQLVLPGHINIDQEALDTIVGDGDYNLTYLTSPDGTIKYFVTVQGKSHKKVLEAYHQQNMEKASTDFTGLKFDAGHNVRSLEAEQWTPSFGELSPDDIVAWLGTAFAQIQDVQSVFRALKDKLDLSEISKKFAKPNELFDSLIRSQSELLAAVAKSPAIPRHLVDFYNSLIRLALRQMTSFTGNINEIIELHASSQVTQDNISELVSKVEPILSKLELAQNKLREQSQKITNAIAKEVHLKSALKDLYSRYFINSDMMRHEDLFKFNVNRQNRLKAENSLFNLFGHNVILTDATSESLSTLYLIESFWDDAADILQDEWREYIEVVELDKHGNPLDKDSDEYEKMQAGRESSVEYVPITRDAFGNEQRGPSTTVPTGQTFLPQCGTVYKRIKHYEYDSRKHRIISSGIADQIKSYVFKIDDFISEIQKIQEYHSYF